VAGKWWLHSFGSHRQRCWLVGATAAEYRLVAVAAGDARLSSAMLGGGLHFLWCHGLLVLEGFAIC